MTNTTWADNFLQQLQDAWAKQADEMADAAPLLTIDAVAGFILAVELAAADTNDEILDRVSSHLAAAAGPDGEHDTTTLLHAALLNLTVTFLKPALDSLQGSDTDVRGIAQQMSNVIGARPQETP